METFTVPTLGILLLALAPCCVPMSIRGDVQAMTRGYSLYTPGQWGGYRQPGYYHSWRPNWDAKVDANVQENPETVESNESLAAETDKSQDIEKTTANADVQTSPVSEGDSTICEKKEITRGSDIDTFDTAVDNTEEDESMTATREVQSGGDVDIQQEPRQVEQLLIATRGSDLEKENGKTANVNEGIGKRAIDLALEDEEVVEERDEVSTLEAERETEDVSERTLSGSDESLEEEAREDVETRKHFEGELHVGNEDDILAQPKIQWAGNVHKNHGGGMNIHTNWHAQGSAYNPAHPEAHGKWNMHVQKNRPGQLQASGKWKAEASVAPGDNGYYNIGKNMNMNSLNAHRFGSMFPGNGQFYGMPFASSETAKDDKMMQQNMGAEYGTSKTQQKTQQQMRMYNYYYGRPYYHGYHGWNNKAATEADSKTEEATNEQDKNKEQLANTVEHTDKEQGHSDNESRSLNKEQKV